MYAPPSAKVGLLKGLIARGSFGVPLTRYCVAVAADRRESNAFLLASLAYFCAVIGSLDLLTSNESPTHDVQQQS